MKNDFVRTRSLSWNSVQENTWKRVEYRGNIDWSNLLLPLTESRTVKYVRESTQYEGEAEEGRGGTYVCKTVNWTSRVDWVTRMRLTLSFEEHTVPHYRYWIRTLMASEGDSCRIKMCWKTKKVTDTTGCCLCNMNYCCTDFYPFILLFSYISRLARAKHTPIEAILNDKKGMMRKKKYKRSVWVLQVFVNLTLNGGEGIERVKDKRSKIPQLR